MTHLSSYGSPHHTKPFKRCHLQRYVLLAMATLPAAGVKFQCYQFCSHYKHKMLTTSPVIHIQENHKGQIQVSLCFI